jgi:threonine dehydratase
MQAVLEMEWRIKIVLLELFQAHQIPRIMEDGELGVQPRHKPPLIVDSTRFYAEVMKLRFKYLHDLGSNMIVVTSDEPTISILYTP